MRRRWLVLTVLGVVVAILAFVDVASLHPALDAVTGFFWTALFWLFVLTVLALLVWQVFPTPSR